MARSVVGSTAARAAAPEAGVIVLENQLSEPNPARFEESLRELLARLGLRLVPASAAPEVGVLARVSIEASDAAVTVSVHSLRGAAAPVHYRVERTLDALLEETLAHVILGAVEPEVSAPLPDPPAAPPPDDPPSAAASGAGALPSPSLWLGARGGPVLVDSERLALKWGGAVGTTLPFTWRPAVALEADYWMGSEVARDGVDARLSRVGARLRARAEPIASERFLLHIGLSGGVDRIALTPGTPSPPSARRMTRTQPLVGASLAGAFRVADAIDIVASLGLDVDLAPRRFMVEIDSERSELVEARRLLPSAVLGFEWRIAGASPPLGKP